MDKIEDISKIDDLFFVENEGEVWRYVLDSTEKPLLERIMRYTKGNQLKAARILGINRNTLRSKLAKYGLLGR
jgi:DNA-binding protein Fis